MPDLLDYHLFNYEIPKTQANHLYNHEKKDLSLNGIYSCGLALKEMPIIIVKNRGRANKGKTQNLVSTPTITKSIMM